jgi:hypothetical protein
MGLGWHRTAWQRAASAAHRSMAATRPHLDELRDWLNTGWGNPAGQAGSAGPGDLDPFDAVFPPPSPRPATDARPGPTQEPPR